MLNLGRCFFLLFDDTAHANEAVFHQALSRVASLRRSPMLSQGGGAGGGASSSIDQRGGVGAAAAHSMTSRGAGPLEDAIQSLDSHLMHMMNSDAVHSLVLLPVVERFMQLHRPLHDKKKDRRRGRDQDSSPASSSHSSSASAASSRRRKAIRESIGRRSRMLRVILWLCLHPNGGFVEAMGHALRQADDSHDCGEKGERNNSSERNRIRLVVVEMLMATTRLCTADTLPFALYMDSFEMGDTLLSLGQERSGGDRRGGARSGRSENTPTSPSPLFAVCLVIIATPTLHLLGHLARGTSEANSMRADRSRHASSSSSSLPSSSSSVITSIRTKPTRLTLAAADCMLELSAAISVSLNTMDHGQRTDGLQSGQRGSYLCRGEDLLWNNVGNFADLVDVLAAWHVAADTQAKESGKMSEASVVPCDLDGSTRRLMVRAIIEVC